MEIGVSKTSRPMLKVLVAPSGEQELTWNSIVALCSLYFKNHEVLYIHSFVIKCNVVPFNLGHPV